MIGPMREQDVNEWTNERAGCDGSTNERTAACAKYGMIEVIYTRKCVRMCSVASVVKWQVRRVDPIYTKCKQPEIAGCILLSV